MKPPTLLNRYLILVLAAIYIAIDATPTIWENPTYSLVVSAGSWCAGFILLLLKKRFGALLLATLSVYDLINDILLEIPRLKIHAANFADLAERVGMPVLGLISIAIGIQTVFLACFIYYGLYVYKKGSC